MPARRRCLLALAFLVAAFSPAAHADSASQVAKVQQLFTLIHLEQTYTEVMQQATAQSRQLVQNMLPTQTLTDAQKQKIATLQQQTDALVQQSFSWQTLEPEYVKLYCDRFSEAEIDAILAFYQSPAGQVMIAKTPELIRGSSAIVNARSTAMQPRLRALLEDFMHSLTDDQNTTPK